MPRPAFSELPLRKDGPPGNAWGLYGDKDELGALNLLNPENTALAAKEIQDGTRVSIDQALGYFKAPCFQRNPLEHKMWLREPHLAFDDSLLLNTQSSSQWDGFRHVAYQKERLFYGGRTLETVQQTDEIGVHSWTESGGIVGRGVLLDYASWADAKGLKPAHFETESITVETLKKVADHQGTTFREGDILFLRSGWGRAYNALDKVARQALADHDTPPSIGVESCEEMLKWIWDNGFAAVAGDHPSVEASPFQSFEWMLHQWLLSGWGCPLGELFDLERLGEECAKRKRWTFFFTSAPLRVPGGVATPPNGIAIF